MIYVYANWIAECKESAQCAPIKHHYDDCVERVQKQESEGEVTEDCVEECEFLSANISGILAVTYVDANGRGTTLRVAAA